MSIEHTLCPICNTRMVTAKSQYGSYWRCPKWGCEGTRNAEGLSKGDRDEKYERGERDEPRGKRRYE